MFERLQKKWGVSPGRLLLILITFALGGSATGYVGRKIMDLTAINTPWIYIPIYIIVVTIVWPAMVLLVSIPFGQFTFFRSYIIKLFKKISGRSNKTSITRIAIFASGAGSNAQKIIDHFRNHPSIKIALIACNKPGAGVLNIAQKENIPTLLIEKEPFFRGDACTEALRKAGIDFIVLAGFLWKIPLKLISQYPNRIVNIHPALLPKYGGKGLYGHFVHEAVIAAGEKESGITIHYVDEHYDHGDHILQEKVTVEPHDTPESLARKIQQLEHRYFPAVIESVIQTQNRR
ncbi:MAG TPA: phosphoribosylglycinamide formyltransferase [Chitinophagaceae bacterium]|nr:phosphoribosylglycinamide formyltransferase [Chitinophagaceae bacterium]